MTRAAKNNRSLLRRFAENPILNITVGFILLATSLLECLEPLYGKLLGSSIGVHHGAALFGMVQFLKWLPDALKGLQFVEHGEDATALHTGAGA